MFNMAQLMANDLGSPVSLLWAHQLRREHAMVVEELDNLKQLQPLAATINELVEQAEDKDSDIAKMRKELDDLNATNQRAIGAINTLKTDFENEKTRDTIAIDAHKERQQAICSSLERLNRFLERQEHDLKEIGEIRKEFRREKEFKAQEADKKSLEISELRNMLAALDRKLDGTVVAVLDSVDQTKYAKAGLSEESSEVDPSDLDRNVPSIQTEHDLEFASLAMIPEVREQITDREPSEPSEPEPAMKQPEKHPEVPKKPEPAQRPQSDNPPIATELHFKQGKETLKNYLLTTNTQRQLLPAEYEEDVVNAFINGLYSKANIRKAKGKLKKTGITWENLLDCFPTASQVVRRQIEQTDKPEAYSENAENKNQGSAREFREPMLPLSDKALTTSSVSQLDRNGSQAERIAEPKEKAKSGCDEAPSQNSLTGRSNAEPASSIPQGLVRYDGVFFDVLYGSDFSDGSIETESLLRSPDLEPVPQPIPLASDGSYLPLPKLPLSVGPVVDHGTWKQEIIYEYILARRKEGIPLLRDKEGWDLLLQREGLNQAPVSNQEAAYQAEQRGRKRKAVVELETANLIGGTKKSKGAASEAEISKGRFKGKVKARAKREKTPTPEPALVFTDEEEDDFS